MHNFSLSTTSFLLFVHIHLNFLDFHFSFFYLQTHNNNVLFGAFNFTSVHFHATMFEGKR